LAHDDENKPKTPTKAVGDLKKARAAMDAYKSRLIKEGKYGCCMQKPMGSKVNGCDMCAKTNGSCNCGANLAQGKGACGECYGAWKGGKGHPAFGKVDLKTLKILASDHQHSGEPMPMDRPRPNSPEWDAYVQAMSAAKRTMLAEQRFACCIGGGCDECAHEGYCPCGRNLAKDLEAKPSEAKPNKTEPTEEKRGVCAQCLDGQHGGHGRVGNNVDPNTIALAQMEHMEHEMPGLLGPWRMNREGSGTSWLPDSSPMYGKMGMLGRWQTMQMGMGFAAYTDTGGLRGERQFFTPTQYMIMARRETGGGIIGLRGMISLDPLLIGGKGYPNLFQTGETYLGRPLKDRQHPHDLFMELAASYSVPIGGRGDNRNRAFLYFAPVGEPPLGMAAFPHRPSAWDNPISPITHHWFDGTHITFGVATLGLAFANRWKVEVSSFTGREPNEDRYGFDTMRFDSFGGRITFNPSRDWSFQTSYAFLKEPEPLESGSQHRLTASAQYNKGFANGANFAGLLAYGRNIKSDHTSDAWLLEGAYTRGRWIMFGRWENVAKDELVDVPEGSYRINKFSLGGTYNFQQNRHVEQGIGASVDFYSFPGALKPLYGSDPVGFSVFYRLRFGKM
jgi:hypothetical protein